MKKKELETKTPAEILNEEETEAEPQESKGKRIASGIINVILVLAIILAAICTYVSYVSTSGNGVPSIFGIRIFSIQTESMYPTLLPGDLIFDTGVKDSGELRTLFCPNLCFFSTLLKLTKAQILTRHCILGHGISAAIY